MSLWRNHSPAPTSPGWNPSAGWKFFNCALLPPALVTSTLTLSNRWNEVKVIDFLPPIKIGLPRIYLQSHKEFFAIRFGNRRVDDAEKCCRTTEVNESKHHSP